MVIPGVSLFLAVFLMYGGKLVRFQIIFAKLPFALLH